MLRPLSRPADCSCLEKTLRDSLPDCADTGFGASMRQMLPQRSPLRLMLVAFVALTAFLPSHAQEFDLGKDREPVTVLNGLWRFQPGDDPQWASPSYDDSKWPLIKSDESWSDQGYEHLGGTAWYRARIVVPKSEEKLAIFIPRMDDSYQVFANGVFIGGRGSMPPIARPQLIPNTWYLLPQTVSGQVRVVTLAVRLWHWPHWAGYVGGGFRGNIRVGYASLIEQWANLQDEHLWWGHTVDFLFAWLYVLAGLSGIALFVFGSREREYLWFGIAQLLAAMSTVFHSYLLVHPFGMMQKEVLDTILDGSEKLAEIAFYLRLLKGRRNWLFWSLFAIWLSYSVIVEPAGLSESISMSLWVSLETLTTVPISCWIIGLLVRRAVQGLPDARLLLAPVLFQNLLFVVDGIILAAYTAGWNPGTPNFLLKLFGLSLTIPFAMTLSDIASLLFLLAVLTILIHRFTRTRRDKDRLTTELEAARIVQSILVPTEIPVVPGFVFASVYRPASQVGGDFFQIIPTANEGVLVLIGDVSGKGMPAAMTVSLLVGTIRTLAHYTQRPGEILAAMNQRMLARSAGGFTTCLALLVDTSGDIAIANAGHIAPILNDGELQLQNGLPLGLAAESVYAESTFHVGLGDQLTLMTDGVVEARNNDGELFGFERTAAIASSSAETIAEAAQTFGQEDDITVVTLKRLTDERMA